MRGNILFTIFMALLGLALLLSLGIWQWGKAGPKAAAIARIESRLTEAAGALPETPREAVDEYQGVALAGRFLPGQIKALTASPQGPGYRIIAPFETSGRVVLVDRGFVPKALEEQEWPIGQAQVIGNLHWPNEGGGLPDPDLENMIWFSRDVPQMAAALQTEPVMIVQRNQIAGAPIVRPVTPDISNSHFGYAIQWFCMAAVWAMMTSWYIWRMWRGRNEKA